MTQVTRIDLSKPKYDQSTFSGRLKHFFKLTNPLNIFVSSSQLNHAKNIVEEYKSGKIDVNEKELWDAKYLVDSAYHPDTGDKMFIYGRMSSQVPMNMLITGCMLTFYKKYSHIIFWQWVNQSFNAVVNYTNRSGSNPISNETLAASYISATGSALSVGIGLNKLMTIMNLPKVMLRFAPFMAVMAANCVNIPLMRINELRNGISVFDNDQNYVGNSKKAAKNSILMVMLSRNVMPIPSMITIPVLMEKLERRPFLNKFPMFIAPLQVLLFGIFLFIMTPFGCALFPQQSSLPIHKIEPHLREKVKNNVSHVYFNKGL